MGPRRPRGRRWGDRFAPSYSRTASAAPTRPAAERRRRANRSARGRADDGWRTGHADRTAQALHRLHVLPRRARRQWHLVAKKNQSARHAVGERRAVDGPGDADDGGDAVRKGDYAEFDGLAISWLGRIRQAGDGVKACLLAFWRRLLDNLKLGRWVVERFFAWINRNRRLAKDFEATIASAEAFLYAASVMMLTRRLARST